MRSSQKKRKIYESLVLSPLSSYLTLPIRRCRYILSLEMLINLVITWTPSTNLQYQQYNIQHKKYKLSSSSSSIKRNIKKQRCEHTQLTVSTYVELCPYLRSTNNVCLPAENLQILAVNSYLNMIGFLTECF